MKNLYLLLTILLLASCEKEQVISPKKRATQKETNTFTQGTPGIIIINDFAASGSEIENEFGNNQDWIELLNTTPNTLQLEAGKWFITDNYDQNPRKYALPELTLTPHQHLIIWCDNMNTVEDNIHTNFKLASAGEKLGLFYNNKGNDIAIDLCNYCGKK